MAESTLTEAQKQRLGELSAEAMGWHKCPDGAEYWETEHTIECRFEDWHPWRSLGQAVMVAELRPRWAVGVSPFGADKLYMGVVSDGAYEGYADCPAEALLLANAAAWGWEYGDE